MNVVIGFIFVISIATAPYVPSEIGDIVNPERPYIEREIVLGDFDTLSECQNARLEFIREMVRQKLTGSYSLACEAVSATSL